MATPTHSTLGWRGLGSLVVITTVPAPHLAARETQTCAQLKYQSSLNPPEGNRERVEVTTRHHLSVSIAAITLMAVGGIT
jgi:hypothetical protein